MLERAEIPNRIEASSKVAQYRGNTGFIWGSKLAQNIVNKLSRKFSLSCDRFYFFFFFCKPRKSQQKSFNLGEIEVEVGTLLPQDLDGEYDCSTDRHNYKKKAWYRELGRVRPICAAYAWQSCSSNREANDIFIEYIRLFAVTATVTQLSVIMNTITMPKRSL